MTPRFPSLYPCPRGHGAGNLSEHIPNARDSNVNENNTTEILPTTTASETTDSPGRREALAKLGKLTYTAPVLVTLLLSSRASAISGLPPCPPVGPPFPPNCE